jgi:hypothetical protein
VKDVHYLSLATGEGRGFSCIRHCLARIGTSIPFMWCRIPVDGVEKSTVLNFQQNSFFVKGRHSALRILCFFETLRTT